MDILIARLWQAEGKATIGNLYLDGAYECFSLEPAAKKPVHEGHPCIPAGRYRVRLRNSPRFGLDTIELIMVPGRTDILMHAGNTAHDTLGCIAVGYDHAGGTWEIHRSKDALKKIKGDVVRRLKETEQVWVEVHDSFAGAPVA